MDPLSSAANIIAVVDSAKKASDGLRKILSLKQAPQEVLQFMNEISDFRAVITLAQECFRLTEKSESHQDILDLKARTNEKLSHAMATLEKLNDIIYSRILISQSTPTTVGIKIYRKEWLRTNREVKRLLAGLRNTRSEISEVLTIITVSGVPQTRVTLRGIVLESQQLNTAMQDLETNIANQLTEIQPKIQAIHSSLREIQSSFDSNRKDLQQSIRPTFQLKSSIYRESACDRLCICQCHQNLTLISPTWLRDFLGALLFGYHGAPLWYRRSCNEKFCKREETCLLNAVYLFPAWFLRRMIYYKHTWDPTHGHLINIRTPRVIDSTTSPIFLCASFGNIKGMQDLFAQGLASPFDVGGSWLESPLLYAVTNRQLNSCKFLLSQHADPSAPDMKSRSPLDHVWDKILVSSPNDPFVLGLRRVFGKFLDVDDNLQHRKFTTLHKIVLRLSAIPLADQLLISTADIDVQCSMGGTPLYWAIRRNDSISVQALINCGANTLTATYDYGSTPIHAAAGWSPKSLQILLNTMTPLNRSIDLSSTTFPRILPNILADGNDYSPLEYKDKKGRTPLQFASQFELTGASVLLLLNHLAHVNSNSDINTPLLFAIQSNNHPAIKHLLAWDADCNAKDEEQMGVLHLAAGIGNLETLKILLAARIKVKRSWDKDLHGHTPIEVFETDRFANVIEDFDTRAQSKEVFLAILSLQEHSDIVEELDLRVENSDAALSDEELNIFYDFEEPIGTTD